MHINERKRSLATLAATALALGPLSLGVSVAWGQNNAPDTAATSADSGAASESEGAGATLAEITVTAEKITTDVLHAPLSVTAINGDDLQRDEVHNTVDIQAYVPGLSVTNTVLNTNFNIRGVGSDFTSPNITQGVPVYRDGLLVPPNEGDEPLWDIANVQVLRGPQGTLVGANSTGGAVFINAVGPTLGDSHGYMQVSGGDYHHLNAQGAVDLPIGDTLAARVGIYYEKRDSYSTNLTPLTLDNAFGVPSFPNRPEPGDLNMASVRASLLWQPTDRFHMLARATYFQNLTGYAAEKPIPIANTTVNGVTTVCPAPGSYFPANPTTWTQVPQACGNAPFAPADPYTIAYAAPDTQLLEGIWRESLEADYQLTESGMALRLFAGAAFNTIRLSGENTASTSFTGGISNSVHEHTLSLESDLISPLEHGFKWVLGSYYWIDPATIRALIDSYSGGPVGAGPGYTIPLNALEVHANNSKLSDALFGTVNFQIAPHWKAEMGVRETWDRNSNPFTPCGTCPGGDANAFYFGTQNPINPLGPFVFSGSGQANLGYESDAFLTWKAALNYDVTPADYLYALAATGAKSGGIQGQQLGQNFSPERDTDFELGLKSTRLSGNLVLQLDSFFTRYANIQTADIEPSTGLNSIYNAGSARIYGLEFSERIALPDWEIGASASLLQSSFSSGSIVNSDVCALDAQCGVSHSQCPPGVSNGYHGCFDYTSGGLVINNQLYPWLEPIRGLRLPNSPTLQFSLSVAYEFHLHGNDVLTPRFDVSYQGRQYSQIYGTPFDLLPARKNLNVKFGYRHGISLWEVYVTNLTNEIYPIAQNDVDAEIFNSPRQYGVRLDVRF